MARAPVDCTILDDDGAPHAYHITPHTASEGLRIGSRLVALAGPALGGLVGKVVGAGQLAAALEDDLDLGALARELGVSLAAENVPDLVQKLLSNCVRDKLPLSNLGAFESAYQANYGELAEACAKVIEVERYALFFRRTVGRIGSALSQSAGSPPAPASSSPPAPPTTA